MKIAVLVCICVLSVGCSGKAFYGSTNAALKADNIEQDAKITQLQRDVEELRVLAHPAKP